MHYPQNSSKRIFERYLFTFSFAIFLPLGLLLLFSDRPLGGTILIIGSVVGVLGSLWIGMKHQEKQARDSTRPKANR